MMTSLLFLAAVIAYFIFAHKHVLNHFGLTDRDNNLMWIGLLIPGVFTNGITFILGAFSSQMLFVPLAFCLLSAFFVYSSYQRL